MKISIDSNVKEITKGLKRFQKKQIPFATSKAINDTLTALAGKPRKIGILGKQMEQKLDRPTPTTQKGFFVIRATKKKLIGELRIKDFVEDYLKFQIDGGVRFGNRGRIGVPTDDAKLNSYGNIPGRKKGLIRNKRQKILTVNGMTGVYEQHKDRTLTLMVAFKNFAKYKPKFPFFRIGGGYIENKFNDHFVNAMREALRTAK